MPLYLSPAIAFCLACFVTFQFCPSLTQLLVLRVDLLSVPPRALGYIHHCLGVPRVGSEDGCSPLHAWDGERMVPVNMLCYACMCLMLNARMANGALHVLDSKWTIHVMCACTYVCVYMCVRM